jgi:hypothetical protein
MSLAGVNYSLWAVEIVSLLANKIASLFTEVRRAGNFLAAMSGNHGIAGYE